METKGNYVKNRTVVDLKLKNHEAQSTVTSEILLMEQYRKLKNQIQYCITMIPNELKHILDIPPKTGPVAVTVSATIK